MNTMFTVSMRSRRLWIILWLLIVMCSMLIGMPGVPVVRASEPIEVGYRDFSYPSGTGGNSEVTGEKPESKLWWNDGFWWGSLWSSAGNAYHIYRLDLATQDWVDTGTAIDDRSDSRADTLWDGQSLYVVSHIFAASAVAAPAGERGELYRYSYDAGTQTYTLDAGFPVEVTGGKSETLVLAKDSVDTLWVTYVENRQVMVNHSLNGDDSDWGTPFVLPVGNEANVTKDDISSVIAYNQHIGIMWSNQNSPKTMYFAVHPTGTPDTVWTKVRSYTVSGDDHINLKSLQVDSAGDVFAVIKTSQSSALIVLLVCENNLNRCKSESDWTSYPVYNADFSPTRPILLIDTDNRELYVFNRVIYEVIDLVNHKGIYYKKTDMDNIQFDVGGIGTPFIKSATETGINDPTSTKQNLNNTTGLVVLASDKQPDYYFHNYLDLAGGTSPIITSFSPSSGAVGTEVIISGANFMGVTEVAFNGTPATSFTVDSYTQIRADVPAGATTGPISVTNAFGTGQSGSNFGVSLSPVVTARSPEPNQTNVPVDTVVTATFSKAMNGSTFDASSFKVEDSGNQVLGAIAYDSATRTVTFTPGNPLKTGTEYTVTLTGAIKDVSGNPLFDAPEVWTFTTEPAVLQFDTATSSVDEDAGAASITVTLTPASSETVEVHYATSDGTAQAGVDYTAISDALTFAPGDISKTFTVPIIDDEGVELDETVILTLSGPSNAALGTPASATLTIVDNEGTPCVQYDSLSFNVGEGDGSATIVVTLSHPDLVNPITVDYATSTSGSTATTGDDYTPIPTTKLTFVPGDTSESFTVEIVPDEEKEKAETVSLTLGNPSANAILGTPANATLTIVDDDAYFLYLPLFFRNQTD